jgi:hypothetical protein
VGHIIIHCSGNAEVFHQQRSKLGTLLQIDANETEMKKKIVIKILTVRLVIGSNLTVDLPKKSKFSAVMWHNDINETKHY